MVPSSKTFTLILGDTLGLNSTKLEPQRDSHRDLNRRTVKHWMLTIGGWLGDYVEGERQPQHSPRMETANGKMNQRPPPQVLPWVFHFSLSTPFTRPPYEVGFLVRNSLRTIVLSSLSSGTRRTCMYYKYLLIMNIPTRAGGTDNHYYSPSHPVRTYPLLAKLMKMYMEEHAS